MGDYKIGSKVNKAIKYADALVLMGNEVEKLQVWQIGVETGRNYTTKVNVEKYKV